MVMYWFPRKRFKLRYDNGSDKAILSFASTCCVCEVQLNATGIHQVFS